MDVSEVISGRVYQGPAPQSAEDWAQLQAKGIDAIIDLQTELENGPGIALPPVINEGQFVLIWAPIYDGAPPPSNKWLMTIANLAEVLYKAGFTIYIHCQMGISRASLVNTVLHMAVYKIGWREALNRIKTKRPIVNPNESFLDALESFDKYLKENTNGF